MLLASYSWLCHAPFDPYPLKLELNQEKLLDLVNAVFGLLAILGIVNDPTTAGFRDSARAMGYDKPKE